jgi:hypothetical protein
MEKNMAEKTFYEQLLADFGIDSSPKYTNQELGLGSIGNTEGQIYSTAFKNGGNLDMSKASNYLKPSNTNINTGSGTSGETGLGSIFSSDGMKTLGNYAQTGQAILGLYSGLDNLFGSGARDRKESKNMMKKAFEQNYAMNDLAINKFKEDNNRFKADRERISSSYMA